MGESHENLADDLKRAKQEEIAKQDNKREREKAQKRRYKVVDDMRKLP